MRWFSTQLDTSSLINGFLVADEASDGSIARIGHTLKRREAEEHLESWGLDREQAKWVARRLQSLGLLRPVVTRAVVQLLLAELTDRPDARFGGPPGLEPRSWTVESLAGEEVFDGWCIAAVVAGENHEAAIYLGTDGLWRVHHVLPGRHGPARKRAAAGRPETLVHGDGRWGDLPLIVRRAWVIAADAWPERLGDIVPRRP